MRLNPSDEAAAFGKLTALLAKPKEQWPEGWTNEIHAMLTSLRDSHTD